MKPLLSYPVELISFFKSRSIEEVKAFIKWLFPGVKAAQNITKTQAYLIKRISFSEVQRLSISAYTRYGKSQMVAIAIAIYILINEGKKVKFIGPTSDQAGIIKDYMSELLLNSRDGILLKLSDIDAKGEQRIKAEASSTRMTFKNGCEYRVVTAHGKGFAAMGHGADLICFPPQTLVKTDKGFMDIKSIVDGEDYKVLSYNHLKNEFEYKPVVRVFQTEADGLIRIYYKGGFIDCTPNHPFYVKGRGYVLAQEICYNDKIYKLHKLPYKNQLQQGLLEEKTVRKIERIPYQETVYNLEVKDNNNYFAGGILVHNCMDEAAMISRESYAKITRMLGDDPAESTLVELFNPWDRDTKAHDHSISERFERVRIDWRVGVREGRTTESYIEEQREDITPLEFTVLYESEFPEEGEDSLFSLRDVDKAIQNDMGLKEELEAAEAVVEKPYNYSEREVRVAKETLKSFVKVVSCDPADKGLDQTVALFGLKKGGAYEVVDYYVEDKSESMTLVGTIWRKAKAFIGSKVSGVIIVDRIGVGVGAVSRLKELSGGFENIKVVGAGFGEKAMSDKEFLNKKAENYFRLRSLLQEGLISLKPWQKLKSQLLAMRWDLTSGEKKRILDPEGYSPDWSDALVYFVWKDKKGLSFSFV